MLDWFARCWSKRFFLHLFSMPKHTHTNLQSSLYTLLLSRCCDGRLISIPLLHCNLLMLSTWHGTHISASLAFSIRPAQMNHFIYSFLFVRVRFFLLIRFSFHFILFAVCYFVASPFAIFVDSSQCNRKIHLRKEKWWSFGPFFDDSSLRSFFSLSTFNYFQIVVVFCVWLFLH